MEILNFDSGIKEYQLGNCGILRFNPSDPNVYARFMEAADNISAIEDKLVEDAKALGETPDGGDALKLMAQMDADVKTELNHVFGGTNDFNEIMRGVNLLAVASNGERVITNLLNALEPIMRSGAEQYANNEVETAKRNREQRRAAQRK